jgi:hypothetical protein
MTSDHRRRTPSEIRAIQEQLEHLADNPQLRHRLGIRRVTTEAPFAGSRRRTDPNDRTRRHVMDVAARNSDRERNYAAGLL